MPAPDSPVLTGLDLPGLPVHWEALGFSLPGGAFNVGAVAFRVGYAEPRWTFDRGDVAGNAIGSIPVARACGVAKARSAQSHPNQVRRVDHVVVASECPRATQTEMELVGFVAKGARVVDTPKGARSQHFFWSGDLLVELVGPADAKPSGASAARIWGVTFVVDSFDALSAVAGGLLSEQRAAVQPGRQIVTVRKSALIGVQLAFMTPHQKA